MSDDLRGSAPVYSAKDVLQSLDGKVDKMSEQLAILVNQDLGSRVTTLESFKDRMIGLSYAGVLLGIVATILSIVSLVAPAQVPVVQ